MTLLIPSRPLRHAAVLGLAAALLCAGHASAQTAPSTFQIFNYTFSTGDPVFSVTDDVTFTDLKITELFQDNTTATVLLDDLDTGATYEETPFSFADTSLKSATLTGTLRIDGLIPTDRLDLSLASELGGPTAPKTVFTSFTAILDPAGKLHGPGSVGVGQFSLISPDGTPRLSATINAVPVPEASTMLSLGLLLALGLGGLAVSRRRAASAK